VISRPAEGLFTLDTGSKAVAADPVNRGVIVDFPEAAAYSQSEEHWVWKLEGEPPPIGSIVFIIPTHICPTSALYPGVLVVEKGRQVDYWKVDARDRKISI
jgi:D-serine deaminase-like pyridoxal phosphate-dependent protein